MIYNNTTAGYAGTLTGTGIPNGPAIEFIYNNSKLGADRSGISSFTSGKHPHLLLPGH